VRDLIDVTKRAGVTDKAEAERPPASMRKPLIRIKVDHTGFSTLSNQRFGSMCVDQSVWLFVCPPD
jgi:hypothetical protein